jgi:hypothetical protein
MAGKKKKSGRTKKSGKADRARVSGSQKYEVYYVARKFGVSADTVRKVIKKVGNMRVKVYSELEKM